MAGSYGRRAGPPQIFKKTDLIKKYSKDPVYLFQCFFPDLFETKDVRRV